jgi:hypothetical protein
LLPHDGNVRDLEWYLAYAPWKSDQAESAYLLAAADGPGRDGPHSPGRESFLRFIQVTSGHGPGDRPEAILDALETMMGPWSPEVREMWERSEIARPVGEGSNPVLERRAVSGSNS